MILDATYFLLRYTPFWTVPLIMICGQFGCLYWVKEVKWASYMFFVAGSASFVCLIFYVFQGSPDKAAGAFDSFLRNF